METWLVQKLGARQQLIMDLKMNIYGSLNSLNRKSIVSPVPVCIIFFYVNAGDVNRSISEIE